MTDFDTAHLVYLVMLGCAVVFWFMASNRESMGRVAQQAVVWGLIFLGVIAAVGLWDDIRQTVRPGQAVFSDGNRIELPRAPDGHYYLTAQVNGTPVDFVIDTGATQIVLTQDDARAAGIDPDRLAFVGRAYTANGEVRTAPVRLESITIGPIRDTGVRAVVNEGELEQSLLGMTYLQRFSSVEIANGQLVLTR
ncbi:TIGR02281 family clan AA aspartic protease [Roseovarius sp. TE539]|uniref:retropepsin-like aspartic protease family protein n=1 Tax=Roseovarius sp. TE539 TaxID=2249812 RepID=UPI000DE02EEE|nr:TIGR02281 family clan AA aspartic protease [Roseovarius sp. TE539]RBI71186.1 TIGR02281 family clan AA aspartic protease [Roseovarius sp. TE539]